MSLEQQQINEGEQRKQRVLCYPLISRFTEERKTRTSNTREIGVSVSSHKMHYKHIMIFMYRILLVYKQHSYIKIFKCQICLACCILESIKNLVCYFLYLSFSPVFTYRVGKKCQVLSTTLQVLVISQEVSMSYIL